MNINETTSLQEGHQDQEEIYRQEAISLIALKKRKHEYNKTWFCPKWPRYSEKTSRTIEQKIRIHLGDIPLPREPFIEANDLDGLKYNDWEYEIPTTTLAKQEEYNIHPGEETIPFNEYRAYEVLLSTPEQFATNPPGRVQFRTEIRYRLKIKPTFTRKIYFIPNTFDPKTSLANNIHNYQRPPRDPKYIKSNGILKVLTKQGLRDEYWQQRETYIKQALKTTEGEAEVVTVIYQEILKCAGDLASYYKNTTSLTETQLEIEERERCIIENKNKEENFNRALQEIENNLPLHTKAQRQIAKAWYNYKLNRLGVTHTIKIPYYTNYYNGSC
jgi:hypothetical protein